MGAPLLARALGAAALTRALAARACAELRVGERAGWLDDHEMAAQTVRKELEIAALRGETPPVIATGEFGHARRVLAGVRDPGMTPAAAPGAATSLLTRLAGAAQRPSRPADHRTLPQVP